MYVDVEVHVLRMVLTTRHVNYAFSPGCQRQRNVAMDWQRVNETNRSKISIISNFNEAQRWDSTIDQSTT